VQYLAQLMKEFQWFNLYT